MSNACIILAAGKSKRFGASKMRHRMPNGKTMIEQTVSQYTAHFSALTVVLNHDDVHLSELKNGLAKQPVDIMLSQHSELGMSQSLVAGVQHHLDAEAIMIGLGDMPYVSSDTIAELGAAMAAQTIVVPRCQGLAGNPVSFGRRFFPALLQLTGDQGGKRVIAAHPDSVTMLDVLDQGVLQDIDTPDQVRSISIN